LENIVNPETFSLLLRLRDLVYGSSDSSPFSSLPPASLAAPSPPAGLTAGWVGATRIRVDVLGMSSAIRETKEIAFSRISVARPNLT
jgi:hypothetical protein